MQDWDLYDLIDALKELPDEASPDYESKINRIGASLKLLEQVASDPHLAPALTFGAFYRLASILRRQGNLERFGKVIARYEPIYANRPMFTHQKALFLSSHADIGNLREGLSLAYDNIKKLPGVPGVLHLFAETVTTMGELHRSFVSDQHITAAMQAAMQTIRINPRYAKYYATRARVHILLRDYDQAFIDARRAIALEPAYTPEYPWRVARYDMIVLAACLKKDWDSQQAPPCDHVAETSI